jgi:cytochrome c oxidase assembly protein subunit 15
VRALGWVALGAVVAQGVLGGLRVTLLKDEIGVFHACLAHAFLGILVLLALATSGRSQAGFVAPRSTPRLRHAAIATTALIYFQLIVGATMRHQHRDLSIFDFPLAYGHLVPDTSPDAVRAINIWRDARGLSDVTAFQIWLQMVHRFGAVLVLVAIVTTCALAHRRRDELPRPVVRLVLIWAAAALSQLLLGAATVWSNKAADVATAHVALGATLLALGVAITWLTAGRESIVDCPNALVASRPQLVTR